MAFHENTSKWIEKKLKYIYWNNWLKPNKWNSIPFHIICTIVSVSTFSFLAGIWQTTQITFSWCSTCYTWRRWSRDVIFPSVGCTCFWWNFRADKRSTFRYKGIPQKKTRTTIVVSNGRYTFYQLHFIKHNLSNTYYRKPFIKYLPLKTENVMTLSQKVGR